MRKKMMKKTKDMPEMMKDAVGSALMMGPSKAKKKKGKAKCK